MSMDIHQLMPQHQPEPPPGATAAVPGVHNGNPMLPSAGRQNNHSNPQNNNNHSNPLDDHHAGGGGNNGGGGGHNRKRKRHSANNNRVQQQQQHLQPNQNQQPQSQNSSYNNNNKRKNKQQQNIIICGGGGGAGHLQIPVSSSTGLSAAAAPAPTNNNNNNNNLCSGGGGGIASSNNNNGTGSKSNAENYAQGGGGGGGGRKNFYHKIHFRHVNGSRSRRLQLFPAISKFFLPDKRPRKEIIVPPTKFLLGGNISDPLNLNSLQDGDLEGALTPKSSPMMTPPKVEVIIPPNIRDPLHLLDPVDSIEYEKQLTSPMKKMGKKNGRNNKKKCRLGRGGGGGRVGGLGGTGGHLLQIPEGLVGAGGEERGGGGGGGGGAANPDGEEGGSEIVDNNGEKKLPDSSLGGGREALKLDLSAAEERESLEMGMRKRRISETSTQGGGGGGGNKAKVRRMDSIVSPVIPQPGAHKRPIPYGPQGAPHRNRQRTQSVQSTDNESDYQRDGKPSASTSIMEEKMPAEGGLAGQAKKDEVGLETNDKKNKSKEALEASTGAGAGEGDEPGTSTSLGMEEGGGEAAGRSSTGGPAAAAGGGKGAAKASGSANNNNNKRKKNTIFQFGNYDRYYGYRNLNETMDVRLKVFQQNSFLFKDKDVLDIGCNIGHLTMAVAKNLSPNSVLGIDIDQKLIKRAKQNAQLYVRVPPTATVTSAAAGDQPSTSAAAGDGSQGRQDKNVQMVGGGASTAAATTASVAASVGTPTSPGGGGSTMIVKPETPEESSEIKEDSGGVAGPSSATSTAAFTHPKRPQFPSNIRFVAGNYVLRNEQQLANDERHKYDLILCLSVTKWVHLNYGDVGLKMMFRRIFNQLRPGGKFILEAQNWASYRKKNKLTDRIFRNFQQIEFYPSHFHEYLLSPEVGFSHSYPLGVPRHLSKGFRRPIQLYIKGDFTPSQVMWSDAHHPPQTPYTPYRGIYAEMMCPPPRGFHNSSVWGGGDNTPFRPLASTSQYYNPMETDSYLPSYETEVVNRRYCFQSPLYSAAWSPPPLSSSNSETRTPPKPSTWSTSTTPMTPTNAFAGQGGSVTNTPHHRHVYPPDEPLLDLDNADSHGATNGAAVSSSGDTPRTEDESPEH